MIKTTDFTILGGGIIGMLTARELRIHGASVTIIDSNLCGQESSWAGGGILLPIYPWRQQPSITPLVRKSLDLYPELASNLTIATGIDPELSSCGLLVLHENDIESALTWCKRSKIAYSQLNLPDTSFLSTQLGNSLWLPTIGHIRNPRLLKSVKQDLISKKVSLVEQCNLEAINLEHNQITSIETSKGHFPIKNLIFATGAWTTQVFSNLLPSFIKPVIKPIKGQMLLYEARPETLPYMVLDQNRYLIPRIDGKILVGSTVEDCDFEKQTTQDAYSDLSNFAEKLCPALSQCKNKQHWAGLRPGTPNGIPYIGQHPELENLYVNAGHFRNGLIMAPASAQLLVEIIQRKPTFTPSEPYSFNSLH